ncbi:MAG: hypothetical protein QNJ31_08880 [Candidatus Caenarcaniphilales bacterium]|nr:hypothetical protein [Candidatus Caenarcaniphilales bacterium]
MEASDKKITINSSDTYEENDNFTEEANFDIEHLKLVENCFSKEWSSLEDDNAYSHLKRIHIQ